MARAIRPGTRIDLLSTADGTVLAGEVLALAGTTGGSSSTDWPTTGTEEPPGVFVAVPPEAAARLATASGGMPLAAVSAVIRPPAEPTAP